MNEKEVAKVEGKAKEYTGRCGREESESGREPRSEAWGGMHAGMLWYPGSQQHHPSGNRALRQWLALVGSSPLKGSEISVVRPKQRLKERERKRGRKEGGEEREEKERLVLNVVRVLFPGTYVLDVCVLHF